MSRDYQEIVQKILNKKFSKKIYSGYDAEDVDAFFDEVINYIEDIDNEMKLVDKNKNELVNKIDELYNLIDQKDQLIKTLQYEIDEYKRDGYSNQRFDSELQNLKKQIDELNKNKK